MTRRAREEQEGRPVFEQEDDAEIWLPLFAAILTRKDMTPAAAALEADKALDEFIMRLP